MKVGILITARLGSSRLAQKHLLKANGKPLIYWLFSRFERAFSREIEKGEVEIVIATSEREENKLFLEVVKDTAVTVFFGSDSKIPLRHYECAKQNQFDLVISVDGDDILCSVSAARAVFEAYRKNAGHDIYAVNGLPLGMNLMAYTTAYLEKSLRAASASTKLETGWGRIFIDPDKEELSLGNYDVEGELRFTLDYDEDAEFFKTVIEKLDSLIYTFTDEELINYVLQNKLTVINAHLKEKYWQNYYSEKNKEIQNGN